MYNMYGDSVSAHIQCATSIIVSSKYELFPQMHIHNQHVCRLILAILSHYECIILYVGLGFLCVLLQ